MCTKHNKRRAVIDLTALLLFSCSHKDKNNKNLYTIVYRLTFANTLSVAPERLATKAPALSPACFRKASSFIIEFIKPSKLS